MIRFLAFAVLAALALGACSKPEGAGTASTPLAGAPAATATAAAPAAGATAIAPIPGEPPLPELGEFRIVSVLIGNTVDHENVVVSDTRAFGAKDAIHASVLSIGAHQGLKLSADWRAPDGSIIAKSEQALVPRSDLATTFSLEHPGDWPAGEYQLRIAINGHTVRNERFAVQ